MAAVVEYAWKQGKRGISMKRYIAVLLTLSLCFLVIFLFSASFLRVEAEEEAWDKLWNEAGVFGPSEGLSTVTGKAAVATGHIELRNLVIDGDLYLLPSAGNAPVTLNNVTVTGELHILGGSTVTIRDGQINYVEVNNPANAVSVLAEGNAALWSVRVRTECLLEEKTGSEAYGFGHIYSTTHDTLTLSGNFPTLTVENLQGAVNFRSGQIGKVYMESQADGSVLTLGEQTEIEVLDLVSAVHVKGSGTIGRVVVLANGSVLEMEAKEYEFGENMSIIVKGGVVDATGKHEITLAELGNVVLEPGKSTEKTITVDPVDAHITATSANPDVATVNLTNKKLTIRALAAGRATITVTAAKEGYSTAQQSFTVTVNTPQKPQVTLQGIKDLTLEEGKAGTRNVVTNPADAKVSATSSNTKVATVNVSGSTITVTAKEAGTATINVTAEKAGYLKGGVTFKVTVKGKAADNGTPGTPATPTYTVIAREPTLVGRELVVVKLNTSEPQNYDVIMADGTKLNYLPAEKVFSGEVKEGTAVSAVKKKE